jgi:hypothetical protein
MRTSSCAWFLAALLIVSLAPAVRAGGEPTPEKGGHEGVAFEPGTPTLAEVLAKASADEKPALLDFFTDT